MRTAPLEQAVTGLQSAKDRWAALSLVDRIGYLDRVRRRVLDVAPEWVAAAVRAKEIRPGSRLAGEEWISGPYGVLSWIAAARTTLHALATGRDPLAGRRIGSGPDGQAILSVYPDGVVERLLLHGYAAEVWLQPGIEPVSGVGIAERQTRRAGAVALVLGAGNIASIAPLDVLSKLYADGEVVICKLNPINSYLGPYLRQAFGPLIDDGFVRFVDGGGEVGYYLCHHPGVDSVHITGSARTHDAVVFGDGPAGAERKARGAPLLTKPITSELGGVGPTIVVPGPWSAADLAYQAEHVATQKLHNSGHNCIACQVLVLPASWPGGSRLLAEVGRTLAAADPRPAYYPGAEERRREALAHYPGAEQPGSAVLIEGVDPTDQQAYAFTEEFFGPVLATTALRGGDAEEFLRTAVAFANDTLHGTLGANILLHPRTAADLGPALDAAVANLRYGTVGVNAWTGVGYLTPRATWGAYPGHRLADIGSGIGVVHNALFLDRPQKTVVRGPFAPFPRSVRDRQPTLAPRPPWFVTNRTAATTGRRMTRYAGDGRLRHLPGIVASALRG